MQFDRHEPICQIIDKSLAGAATVAEERTLHEHLATCVPCSEYLETSQRAIAGLGGFSFDVDPGLQEKVLAALALQPPRLRQDNSLPLWWGRLAALMLTVVGSFATWRFAGATASALHLQPAQIQFGVVWLWIAPSVCVSLLFLLLPVSAASWIYEKGSSL
jgi:hypothetical protein